MPFCNGFSHGVGATGFKQHTPFITRLHRLLGVVDRSLYFIEMKLGSRAYVHKSTGMLEYGCETLQEAMALRERSALAAGKGVKEQVCVRACVHACVCC